MSDRKAGRRGNVEGVGPATHGGGIRIPPRLIYPLLAAASTHFDARPRVIPTQTDTGVEGRGRGHVR